MKKISFRHQFAPPTIEAIENLERKFRIDFPADYRNWILQFGGGRPVESVFDLNFNGESDSEIMYLYGIGGDCRPYDLESNKDKWHHILPKNYMLIAETDFGAFVGMDTAEGTVLWIELEALQSGKLNTHLTKLIFVDFSSFIDNLRIEQ